MYVTFQHMLDLRRTPMVAFIFLADQAQASKTREVVAQQRVVVLLQEGVKAAAVPIATTKAKRNKVQGFLKVGIRH